MECLIVDVYFTFRNWFVALISTHNSDGFILLLYCYCSYLASMHTKLSQSVNVFCMRTIKRHAMQIEVAQHPQKKSCPNMWAILKKLEFALLTQSTSEKLSIPADFPVAKFVLLNVSSVKNGEYSKKRKKSNINSIERYLFFRRSRRPVSIRRFYVVLVYFISI